MANRWQIVSERVIIGRIHGRKFVELTKGGLVGESSLLQPDM